MKTRIKICGLSTPAEIDAAIEAGADYFGMVHFEKSTRHVSLELAAALRQHAGDRIRSVLLTVNAEPQLIDKALGIVRPDILQFHGDETPEWLRLVRQFSTVGIWKAVGLSSAETLDRAKKYGDCIDLLLLDTPAQAMPGGTGVSFDWSLLAERQPETDWGIAGGLNPDNVVKALGVTRASLVDASSGLESAPGRKDVDKIVAFCQAVRAYDTHSTTA